MLLGGDADLIPVRHVYVESFGAVESAMPTDSYYACLDGPWNGDGDDLWGEPHDGAQGAEIDLLAELYVGRAPVKSAREADNFVNKTVLYETAAHPHPAKAVALGEYLDNWPTWGSYYSRPWPGSTGPIGT